MISRNSGAREREGQSAKRHRKWYARIEEHGRATIAGRKDHKTDRKLGDYTGEKIVSRAREGTDEIKEALWRVVCQMKSGKSGYETIERWQLKVLISFSGQSYASEFVLVDSCIAWMLTLMEGVL